MLAGRLFRRAAASLCSRIIVDLDRRVRFVQISRVAGFVQIELQRQSFQPGAKSRR